MTRHALILAATALAALLTACAGPVTHMPAATPQSWQAAKSSAESFNWWAKERRIAGGSAAAKQTLERVRRRVMPAAHRVCRRTFAPGLCDGAFATMRVVFHEADRTVNAYAAEDGTLGFYEGMVRATGNDGELAAVLAHEVAHILFGHNRKAAANQETGILWGGILGVAMGALGTMGTAQHDSRRDPRHIGYLGAVGERIGGAVGTTAYSPGMELEADHFAVFVLADAGYDAEKSGRIIVRLLKRNRSEVRSSGKSFVSYFNTHPAFDRRLAQWHESLKAVRGGRSAPIFIEQVRKEDRWKKE